MNHQMSALIRTVAASCCLLVLCGCATVTGQDGVSTTPPSSSTPSTALSARALCDQTFPKDELIAWADGTVASFRSFQYGGPTPTRPLESVFPAADGITPGAWCLITSGSDQPSGWWVAIPGESPVLALRDSKPLAEWKGKVSPPVIP
jgi:hypothetical protein